MKKSLCLLTFALLLTTCGKQEGETKQLPPQTAEPVSSAYQEQDNRKNKMNITVDISKIDRSKPFCGSTVTLEDAFKKTDLIVCARAANTAFGVMDRPGVLSCSGNFTILAVLKGTLDEKEIPVAYEVTGLGGIMERRVIKGEEVIIFITTSNRKYWPRFRAEKIIPATQEMHEKIEQLLSSQD